MNRVSKLGRWLCTAGLILGGMLSGETSRAATQVDETLVTSLLPELKNVPAPGWVKPGLQIGYTYANATVAGSYWTYSPNAKGGFIGANGQRYSGDETPSGSSRGVMVTSVMAVGRTTFAAETGISVNTVRGPLIPVTSSAGVGYAGVNDLWIAPEALPRLAALNGPNCKVTRGPFSLGEKEYPAVWITFKSDRSSEYLVIDESSGFVLRRGTATEGAASAVVGPGSGGASTLLTIYTFAGTREVKAPWLGAQMPEWLGKFRTLHYRGQYSEAGFSMPWDLAVTALRHGSDWLETEISNPMGEQQGSVVQRSHGITSSAGTMGYCIPPAGLQNLQNGQVLDENPYTGYKYTVVGQFRGRNGPVMVIREAGPLHAVDISYDMQSGIMVALSKEDHSGPAVRIIRLQYAGMD